MSALLEAVEADREALEQSKADFMASYEEGVGLLDEAQEIAEKLAGRDPENKSAARTAVEPKKKPSQRSGAPEPKVRKATSLRKLKLASAARGERKDAILGALALRDQPVSSRDIRSQTGIDDRAALRKLLDELVDTGDVVKEGQRAGTKYQLSPAARKNTPADATHVKRAEESTPPPGEFKGRRSDSPGRSTARRSDPQPFGHQPKVARCAGVEHHRRIRGGTAASHASAGCRQGRPSSHRRRGFLGAAVVNLFDKQVGRALRFSPGGESPSFPSHDRFPISETSVLVAPMNEKRGGS